VLVTVAMKIFKFLQKYLELSIFSYHPIKNKESDEFVTFLNYLGTIFAFVLA
jgi:hypothetical protein